MLRIFAITLLGASLVFGAAMGGPIKAMNHETGDLTEWTGTWQAGAAPDMSASTTLPFNGTHSIRHRAPVSFSMTMTYYKPPKSTHWQLGLEAYWNRKIPNPQRIFISEHIYSGSHRTKMLMLVQDLAGVGGDSLALWVQVGDDVTALGAAVYIDTFAQREWHKIDIVEKQTSDGHIWIYRDGKLKYSAAAVLDTTILDSLLIGVMSFPIAYADTGNVFYDAVQFDTIPCAPPCGYFTRYIDRPSPVWAGSIDATNPLE